MRGAGVVGAAAAADQIIVMAVCGIRHATRLRPRPLP
jgi:hypothetical protein